jgi:hypothetical protein
LAAVISSIEMGFMKMMVMMTVVGMAPNRHGLNYQQGNKKGFKSHGYLIAALGYSK